MASGRELTTVDLSTVEADLEAKLAFFHKSPPPPAVVRDHAGRNYVGTLDPGLEVGGLAAMGRQ